MKQRVLYSLAWFAAARLTRLVTDDTIASPVRDRVERRAQRRSDDALMSLSQLPPADAEGETPDHARQRRTLEWRFERAQLAKFFLSCPWCVGLWLFGGVTAVAWMADGAPRNALKGPAWFTLPAYALGANWAYALVASWADR